MPHLLFAPEDTAFIRTILSNPGELTNWLVYADWLDEHNNPLQAEFLRLMVRRGQLNNTEQEWYTVEERLQQLRAELPPVWVEVFDRPKIENCDSAFRYKCPKQWENLKVTRDPTVRHCGECNKNVYYCHTLPEAQDRARRGECVTVELGVLRHPDDLKPLPESEHEVFMTGLFDPGYYPSLPSWATYPGTATTPTPTPTPPPAPTPPPLPKRPWWKFW